MKKIMVLGIISFLFGCSTSKSASSKQVETKLLDQYTFLLTEISTEKNPIKVGGIEKNEGPVNERRFLNALAGPNGEKISYYRAGSCCPIKSDKAVFGNHVMLDNYRVTWENSEDTVSIYINMYDYGELKAPVGFTISSYE